MSRSTLFAAGPDGDLHAVEQYPNSCWFGMCIWKHMIDRYLQRELPKGRFWLGDQRFMKKLWQLAYDPQVPWIERVCHAATFDRALVRGSERPAIVAAFRSFMTLVSPECHVGAMADDIEALPEETRAICWQVTSVAENLWRVTDGPEDEEGRAYNIDKDQGHFWLFEEVK